MKHQYKDLRNKTISTCGLFVSFASCEKKSINMEYKLMEEL